MVIFLRLKTLEGVTIMPSTLLECKNYLNQVFTQDNIQFTLYLEATGKRIVENILNHGNNPTDNDLSCVYDFLKNVELWKANCQGDLTGNAQRNSPIDIWASLRGAITSQNDSQKLSSVMGLIGFGSAPDRESGVRPAKRASAVLRFLDPHMWGTVDWRVAAIIGLYIEKCNNDIQKSIALGKKYTIAKMADAYKIIGLEAALYYELQYRLMITQELPRAVDVELAFYAASFISWPKAKNRHVAADYSWF